QLGTYKFLGVSANYLGISLTLASQAAFFVQLTTILVPVAQAAMGVKLPARIWAACAAALGGVALLAGDGAASADSAAALHDLLLGNAFCALAAVFYACYDVRVNAIGRKSRVVPLTTYKTAFQSMWAVSALTAVAAAGSWLPQSSELWEWAAAVRPDELLLIGGVAVFSGAFANGIATLLQISAQEAVGPSRAQLIYATNPMWNMVISCVALREQVDVYGYLGATLFIGALTIAATTPPEP
ncbi:unnamed protein product, partial [Phaeothamnion confervicola]